MFSVDATDSTEIKLGRGGLGWLARDLKFESHSRLTFQITC